MEQETSSTDEAMNNDGVKDVLNEHTEAMNNDGVKDGLNEHTEEKAISHGFDDAQKNAELVLTAVAQVQKQTREASKKAHEVSDHFQHYNDSIIKLVGELDKVTEAQK